jgi:hypothetical protein
MIDPKDAVMLFMIAAGEMVSCSRGALGPEAAENQDVDAGPG